MAENIVFQILRSHLMEGELTPGAPIAIRVDQTLGHDLTGIMAGQTFLAVGADRVQTEASVFYCDHNTLCVSGENADDHLFLKTAAARFGVYFSKPGNGICHFLHCQRFARPGKVMLGADSHTPTSGALGMLAIGSGGLTVAEAALGQGFRMNVPKVMGVKLVGRLHPGVAAKDIALELLRQDACERGIPLRLFGLLPEERDRLEALCPGRFRFHSVRDSADYVYETEQLAQLHGKKLQAKRNHCNRFEAAYPDYRVLPLTADQLPRCRAFTDEWYRLHFLENDPADYALEQRAIGLAFDHFDALGMTGLVLEVEGEVVAFAMGNPIRPDMFDVNFEKARADMNGPYPMINREFARRIAETPYRFLNREDDMGLEGLRRAKESYIPDLLLEKLLAEELPA